MQVTDAQGCSVSSPGGLNGNGSGGITIFNNYYVSPSCLFGPGYIDMGYFGGTGAYNLLWSTGDIFEDIFINTSGKFVFSVTDINTSCVATYDVYVNQLLPSSPVVCMVPVDSSDYHNVVVFDKSTSPDADYFNIYREGYCNNNSFGWVGSVDGDSLSVFNDTVVNTDTRNWRYYVTSVDSCGFESLPSEIHRTIHLSAALTSGNNIQLEWSGYLGESDPRRFFRGGDYQIAGVGDGFERNSPPWIETVKSLWPDFPVYGSMIEASECVTRLLGQLNTMMWIGEYPERFGQQILRIGEHYYRCAVAEIEAARASWTGS